MALLATTAATTRSPTFDEAAHVTAGVSYLQTGDFRLQPQNGLLPQAWAGSAVAADPAVRLPPNAGEAWDRSDVWTLGNRFLFSQGNDLGRILGRSRAMITVLALLCATLVWLWSRSLFGPAGGLLSLAACALSPAMLAHGATVTSDVAAALFFLASTAALWRLTQRLNVGGVLMAVAALCGLALSKASVVLIGPVAAGIVAVRVLRGDPLPVGKHRLTGRASQVVAIGAVAALVAALVVAGIWAAYGFRYSAFDPADAGTAEFSKPLEPMLERSGALEQPIRVAMDRQLLPEAWLYGLTFVLAHSHERPAFLRGEVRSTGWWWFFPYAFAVKTPLALLALMLLGIVGALRSDRRAELAPLGVLIGVYWLFALTSNINIGDRHLLPTLPPLFVLVGGAARWLRGGSGPRLAILALVGGLALTSASAFPRYLGWFNSLVGGPQNGWKHLVDSSLDWGQDLPALAAALQGRDGQTYVSYFGNGDPASFGVRARALPSFMPLPGQNDPAPITPGLYAISATMLQALYLRPQGAWTEEYEALYQQSRLRNADWRASEQDPALRARLVQLMGSEQAWRDEHALFAELRFARLAATLRTRDPDGYAGWSILLYAVDAAELSQALDGPPPG